MTPQIPSRHAYAYVYSLLAPLTLPLIRPSVASSAPPTLSMDTPPPIAQCAAGTFTWQGGRPPYTLSVRDSHTGTRVFSNSGLTDTIFHWVAAVAAGTDLTVELADTGVSGAGGGRLEDNFVVVEGSDACLSNGGTSSSSSITSAQATGSGTSPPTSTSTSHTQPTTSAVTPSSASSDSTTAAPTSISTPPTGSPSSTGTDGTPSQTPTGSAAGTTDSTGNTSSGGPAPPGGSSIGLATTSTSTSSSGRSTDTSTGTPSSGRAGAGTMIAGAAVGSLVAGFVLAAGLFCVWRARRGRRGVVFCGEWRQRRGRGRERLEPYEYPSADSDPTFALPTSVTVATLSPPERENVLDFDGGPDQPNATADPVVRERQGPGKSRWDDLLSPSIQPSTPQRADLAALNGTERSRVMDAVDGTEGSQEIRAGDVQARRRRDYLGDLGVDSADVDVEDAFRLDLADYSYSEYSASTAPPPYSQIV